VALEAHDQSVRASLKSAAEKYLAGDRNALDPSFLGAGLAVISTDGGLPEAKRLIDMALSSEDQVVRQSALGAAAASGRADVANYLLNLQDKRLRSYDRFGLIFGLATTAGTRDLAREWIFKNYDKMAAGGNGIFFTSRLPATLDFQCGADQADRISARLGPSVRKADVGVLQFARTVELVRNCGILKKAKMAEIAAALNGK
jgi:hypothetical protein